MHEKFEIITCSYGPDFGRCERLCHSIDHFVPGNIQHTLVVPYRDLNTFLPLQNKRRRVFPVESVVPGKFRQLPLSDKYWLSGNGMPVRGWIMQQITKLSANFASDAELLLFADSDLQFVNPFDSSRLYRDNRLRLHRVPGAMDHGVHLKWHHQSAKLLGRPKQYFGSDYVGQLITWRRSNLTRLQHHIEVKQARPWYDCVTRSLRFSEYTLYGAFAEHVLGDRNSGHYFTDQDLCHCCWFRHEADALTEGREAMPADAMALLIQSNMHLSEAEEQQIYSAALRNREATAEAA